MKASEMTRIAPEFDAIAALDDTGFGNNAAYHRDMLRQLPGQIDRAPDAGCGRGGVHSSGRSRRPDE